MPKEINRRQFIQKSAAIGLSSVLSETLASNIKLEDKNIDIVVVKGQDYFKNTKKAVETLGGDEKICSQELKGCSSAQCAKSPSWNIYQTGNCPCHNTNVQRSRRKRDRLYRMAPQKILGQHWHEKSFG